MAMRFPEPEKPVTIWKINDVDFGQLVTGKKTVEVKIATSDAQNISEKSLVVFYGHQEKFLITQKSKKFKNFEELLKVVDAGQIYPGKDDAEVLEELRKKFSSSREHFGAYAFSLTPYVAPAKKVNITYSK